MTRTEISDQRMPYRRAPEGSERVWSLNVNDIRPDPSQARKIFEAEKLRELSESIKEFGVMQPLIVRKTGNCFTLIAGERRLRAATMAGLGHVPCIISSADEEKAAFMALIENLQRRDLDCFEEAEGLARLISRHGLTQEEAARKLGKSQSAVANKLRLLRLGGSCISAIRRAGLTERHARALLRLENEEAVLRAVEEIKNRKMTVAEAEGYIESLRAPDPAPEKEKTPADRREKPTGRDAFERRVKNAVDAAKKAGLWAEVSEEETDGQLVFTVRLKLT
ncbi:MAG: ParB/RepB/Spo0J family partition protein [Clostridia bacterium]|nr:ParB/RepB/Spo0J family partition protein [Clostridia bacterium]